MVVCAESVQILRNNGVMQNKKTLQMRAAGVCSSLLERTRRKRKKRERGVKPFFLFSNGVFYQRKFNSFQQMKIIVSWGSSAISILEPPDAPKIVFCFQRMEVQGRTQKTKNRPLFESRCCAATNTAESAARRGHSQPPEGVNSCRGTPIDRQHRVRKKLVQGKKKTPLR